MNLLKKKKKDFKISERANMLCWHQAYIQGLAPSLHTGVCKMKEASGNRAENDITKNDIKLE